jgi:aminopeptidase N
MSIFARFSGILFLLLPITYSYADVHSQSNFDEVSVTHLDIKLNLHMQRKYFEGEVIATIENKTNSKELWLDTASLEINLDKIFICDDAASQECESVNAELLAAQPVLGQKLIIPITNATKRVHIFYKTTDKSKGLDWVARELTQNQHPMVATQFQAINARTFVPCQDSPGNRITYNAEITLLEADEGSRVLMAAMERESQDNTYYFKMTNTIPTYLIALAAGVFAEKRISDRVSVFAEPSIVDKAHYEFVDAEKMVQKAEDLLGTYRWGRFDIFIMPPSFTFGGMENPTMTFITPTIINGDRSLVDVIAHELAHSWTGNLVTNKDWNHFWINEGFTRYGERLIIAALYGTPMRDMDICLYQEILLSEVADLYEAQTPELTKLRLDLAANFDPDDAVSFIPYEKGFNFLLWLEQRYSADELLKFLVNYFEEYKFRSIDTETLRDELIAYFNISMKEQVVLDEWLFNAGVPDMGLPPMRSELLHSVDAIVSDIENNIGVLHSFQSKQWCYLLRKLSNSDEKILRLLEQKFGLTKKNSEIKSEFLLRLIEADMKDYDAVISDFVGSTGRLKYIKPVYHSLIKHGRREFAQQVFESHRSRYNHITNTSLSNLFGN